jgi:T4 RnlA family RNA ligase
MNDFQTTLYTNLMTICSNPEQEAFYYVDQSKDGVLYRIFLYRMASYTEFQKPGALECRGHTFRIDVDGNALALVSLPMNKFFNHGENPFVMGLDLATIVEVMDKLDGSLISTVQVSGSEYFLKSKGSLNSTQAQDATKLINTDDYFELNAFCAGSMLYDYTVNLEYMSPDNRIVIGYMKPTLKVLNVRDNRTGEYIARDAYNLSEQFRVAVHALPECGETWLKNTYETQDDIEGYVARLSCGTWFKVKTEKYCALHHTKDSITIPRRLFEACVNGGADDLRAMFAADALAMFQIDEMDAKVRAIYNRLHMNVHAFYNLHKHQERKEYAIAGQSDPLLKLDHTFGLAMNLYLGKEIDVEEFMIKHYKDYGIKDVEVVPEVE